MENLIEQKEEFDIVKFIEKNPLARFTNQYQYQMKMIDKIREQFTNKEQQMFLASFYCYLNYNQTKDFIINFETIWKWCGFSRKDSAKRLLEKYFIENKDYKCSSISEDKGRPVEDIFLNIVSFKKFCMKACTEKADEIHNYYIKLENILSETLEEESKELRDRLDIKEIEKRKIEEENKRLEEEKRKIEDELNKTIKVSKKRDDKKGKLIYVGKNPLDQDAFKVGITMNISSRKTALSNGTTSDFEVKKTWYTRFNKNIEDSVKELFSDNRILQRKEHYQMSAYDEIVAYIDEMVEFHNKRDKNPEQPEERKERVVKNPEMADEKPCNNCKKVKPLNEFFPAKEHRDGRENRCKECVDTLQKAYIEEKRKSEPIPTEKMCRGCRKVLSLDHFYTDNNAFDKKGTKCKECIYDIQHREREKEEVEALKCAKCKEVKLVSEFHKLSKSKTGYRYSCKACELAKAKELYHQRKEDFFNEEKMTDEEREAIRLKNRKKTEQESNQRLAEMKYTCVCGSEMSELGRLRHEKTKKHLEYVRDLRSDNVICENDK